MDWATLGKHILVDSECVLPVLAFGQDVAEKGVLLYPSQALIAPQMGANAADALDVKSPGKARNLVFAHGLSVGGQTLVRFHYLLCSRSRDAVPSSEPAQDAVLHAEAGAEAPEVHCRATGPETGI
jgi:hypothetical protein